MSTMNKTIKKEDLIRAKQIRRFSEDFKRGKVKEVENNLTKVSEVCKIYDVSRAAVYKWIYKYSANRKKQVKQIVESMSDTKRINDLQQKVKELEQMVGRQQMIIDFKDKMIDIAEGHYGIEIKKNSSLKPSVTSMKTKKP
jgi:transposase